MCSITAFIILVSVPDLANAERGIGLTQGAIVDGLGSWANILLVLIIFLLAFSSILGNYYYGQSNIEFITKKPGALLAYRLLAIAAVFGGALVSADVVWNFADGAMGFMAIVNLVAIALLSGIAFKLLKDYTEQRRAGLDPVFTRARLPEVKGIEVWENELSVTGPIQVPKGRRG